MARDELKDASGGTVPDDRDRLFGSAMTGPFATLLAGRPTLHELCPAVDVFEEGGRVVVRAEIPGMRKEQLAVRVSEESVTLSGEKREEEKVERKDYFLMESSCGSFSRTLPLPCRVRAEDAEAHYRDGVLEIRLRKAEDSSPKARKIPVG